MQNNNKRLIQKLKTKRNKKRFARILQFLVYLIQVHVDTIAFLNSHKHTFPIGNFLVCVKSCLIQKSDLLQGGLVL